MKLLVAGANGQLGQCLARMTSENIEDAGQFEAVVLARAELDITFADAVFSEFEKHQPDLLINPAAYTAVDRAEDEVDSAYAVNAQGTQHLAAACSKMGIPMVHVSTDYVFDGSATEPYLPDSSTSPIGVYGESKLAGEKLAQAELDELVIVRTAWVYSEYGNNFVKTMLRLATDRDELGVVSDQIGCPTYAGNIAAAILKICRSIQDGEKSWGVYHYVDQPTMSWHAFAELVFKMAAAQGLIEKRPKVNAIASAEYPTKAKRPWYSVLDTQSIQRAFGVEQANVEDALADVLARLSNTSGVVS